MARGISSVTVAARWASSARAVSSSWWKPLAQLLGHQPNLPVMYASVRSSLRRREHRRRPADLDEHAGAAVALRVDLGGEERDAVADACRLLHVVRDDDDREPRLDLLHQVLDARRGDRVEGRARLVHQDHLRLHGDRPGDAQPLLLTAGHAERRALQPGLDLVPQRRAAQRLLDEVVELRLAAHAVDLRAVGDVVVDALGERVRPLEDHPDPPADLGGRDVRGRTGPGRGT